METIADYQPVTAADVTEELVEMTMSVVDGWYPSGRIGWHDVLYRVERYRLDDGRGIDLGEDMGSAAIRELQRRVRALRKLG